MKRCSRVNTRLNQDFPLSSLRLQHLCAGLEDPQVQRPSAPRTNIMSGEERRHRRTSSWKDDGLKKEKKSHFRNRIRFFSPGRTRLGQSSSASARGSLSLWFVSARSCLLSCLARLEASSLWPARTLMRLSVIPSRYSWKKNQSKYGTFRSRRQIFRSQAHTWNTDGRSFEGFPTDRARPSPGRTRVRRT